MLGAVVGGDILEERVKSATETAKRPVNGIYIIGEEFHYNMLT